MLRRPTAAFIPTFDVRTLCIARETLAYRDGPADFAFAMQGLGTGSITLAGSDDLKARYLPKRRARRGHRGLRPVGARGRIGRRRSDHGDARTVRATYASTA